MFQSTPSAWRATPTRGIPSMTLYVSIHALRVEGDGHRALCTGNQRRFNPRPPRGGRLSSVMRENLRNMFQSTPSAWRATVATLSRADAGRVSIHALRVEGDGRSSTAPPWPNCFNPRPPRGGRRPTSSTITQLWRFQSTPSAWRATLLLSHRAAGLHVSIHALRVEGDAFRECDAYRLDVSIHALRVEGDQGLQVRP